jgi:hypothetical protein
MERVMLKRNADGQMVEVPFEYNLITDAEKRAAVLAQTFEFVKACIKASEAKTWPDRIRTSSYAAVVRTRVSNIIWTRAVRTFDPGYCDG